MVLNYNEIALTRSINPSTLPTIRKSKIALLVVWHLIRPLMSDIRNIHLLRRFIFCVSSSFFLHLLRLFFNLQSISTLKKQQTLMANTESCPVKLGGICGSPTLAIWYAYLSVSARHRSAFGTFFPHRKTPYDPAFRVTMTMNM